ncbi:unnamed protein product [Diplocarpon coronariae]|uniref:Guanine nucleotide exchange factor LTE n=1 Tax=Diplocarpon coronariae TaxID=2795749 RepID=A0A218ZC51_9HELO|nr:hypothetical protein JHW43_007383 [Diplocarpon mali]OWP05617.1 guanine nucleotide exchange factor LTE [Marssonina coronariae]
MEPEAAVQAAVQAAPLARTHTPEGLRQRQRDRLAPRGKPPPKLNPIETTARELEGALSKKGATTHPHPPGSKLLGSRSSDVTRRQKHVPGASVRENSVSRRVRREGDDAKNDITPDGGSAGRDGRQFTVGRVGNNGKIYLRPTIRPSNQRYPQPSFVFPPITPPSTAGLEVLVAPNDTGDPSRRDSSWSLSWSPSSPAPQGRGTSRTPHPDHRRAQSASNAEEQHLTVRSSDAGAFRVVIERPGTARKRPEALGGIPTLEVPIPSYRLGTPAFSTKGTAFLCGSSLATADAERSSVFSSRAPSSYRPARILSRRHSDASPRTKNFPSLSLPSPLTPVTAPTEPGRQRPAIAPEMFDALTFRPACDHPSVVRYSASGGIRAATPARLVAEITSPEFVDYDLLSDFFLSYRSFLDTTDLLHMLVARLRWALARDDETGTVVRVRTFVAIRHWILNYFLDDYVVDYDLRRAFCDLLNGFVTELCQDPTRTKVPMKILAELKKCWRRVCALYWDGPEFEVEMAPDVPILPGGVGGSRNPDLDPTFWQTRPEGPPRLDGIIEPDFVEQSVDAAVGGRDFFADVSRAGHLDSVVLPKPDPSVSVTDAHNRPPSPSSMVSEDFVSCSFPSRQRSGATRPLAAHPVPASSIYEPSLPVAMTPKALTGKRIRPAHAPKRSASFSDSVRDRRARLQEQKMLRQQPVQKVIFKSSELLLALPYAGSIVRGNLFPPGQAFVDIIAPSTPVEMNRATTLFPGLPPDQKAPSAMSGPGMRRLLGSVRRALSTRPGAAGTNLSPTDGTFPDIPPLGARGATVNRPPGSAIVPQTRSPHTLGRAPTRIDLLGAEAAEDFEKAVREDAEAETGAEAEPREPEQAKLEESELGAGLQYSSMAPDTTFEPAHPTDGRDLTSEVTTETLHSPVIVDGSLDVPFTTVALPRKPSARTLPDVYTHPSGGLTPPSTPPEAILGTPRRSPQLLGDRPRQRSHSFEGTPSLVVDSHLSGEDERSPTHRPAGRLAMHHRRGLSYKSKGSSSLRRYASFQSGFVRHRSERSYDAATLSESEGPERLSHIPSAPLPLRALRRRPGGDLRAVLHVGDLDTHQLRRPMSTGSMTAYSESIRSSYLVGRESSDYVNVVSSDYDQTDINEQTSYSLVALAESAAKPHVSLLSTHSSQPVMRPSFEKEAQMLAQIPDDVDDDGGVESALLKLEGKFAKRQSNASVCEDLARLAPARHDSFARPPYDVSTLPLEADEEEKRRHRLRYIVNTRVAKASPIVAAYRPQDQKPPDELKAMVYQPKGMQLPPAIMPPRPVESYNAVPLLERGLTDDVPEEQHRNWPHSSLLLGLSAGRRGYDIQTPESSHVNSFDCIEQTDSMRRVPVGETGVDQLFSDNSDSDARSDLSSELSLEVISRTEYTEPDSHRAPVFPPSMAINDTACSHPLRQPPSPEMAMLQALEPGPASHRSPQAHEQQHRPAQSAFPPTPEITPSGVFAAEELGGERGVVPTPDHVRAHRIPESSRKTSVHLPFILAFDSQVLAQQFTLIEKDALNEIDWKDLIEMRWKNISAESRSWVEFLRLQEPRGVEVVIARFNLVVKWAISECVLTQDLGERVRCLIKYIHIAAHCRRYRNFATMTQLTVALTSKDISRLTNTWAYVPAADKATLRELEGLVTPTHNFNSLRAEMEGAGADQGCIPFVGIYTHDLLINSERPSQIASTPTTEPLINFERCRTDATIVKNLLRLLEASTLYRFLPIEGVTERCLWMAALTDDEIARYGKAIQE